VLEWWTVKKHCWSRWRFRFSNENLRKKDKKLLLTVPTENTEGANCCSADDKIWVVITLNCETDFVGKWRFVTLATELANKALNLILKNFNIRLKEGFWQLQKIELIVDEKKSKSVLLRKVSGEFVGSYIHW
jgi:translation elongation factor EF-Ts